VFIHQALSSLNIRDDEVQVHAFKHQTHASHTASAFINRRSKTNTVVTNGKKHKEPGLWAHFSPQWIYIEMYSKSVINLKKGE